MKKILISILTILGVGLSFCNSSDLSVNYSFDFTQGTHQLYTNSFYNLGNNYTFDDSTARFSSENGKYMQFTFDFGGFTGFSVDSITINSIGFRDKGTYYNCFQIGNSNFKTFTRSGTIIYFNNINYTFSGNTTPDLILNSSSTCSNGGTKQVGAFTITPSPYVSGYPTSYYFGGNGRFVFEGGLGENTFYASKNPYIANQKTIASPIYFDITVNFSKSSSCPEPETQSINVYYNNSNSNTSVECDGTQAIEIKGLSSITSTNTRTPYFNINYRDEDNQLLTESYDKDILYLSGGLYKKTYTGNNDWILNVLNVKQESNFTGYIPVFDVTGSTQPLDTDYNMFNNFTDNSLKVLLSNIPGFVQYVIIFGVILLIIGVLKMFKRRK